MLDITRLRITSGKYRGQLLRSPDSITTHPMGAREKLALFNMVDVRDQKVLDAYAGSGALGIEALSRGATEAVFVENNHQAVQILRQNLQQLHLQAPVFAEKVAKFCQNPVFQNYFEVIIADPPYDKLDVDEISDLAKLLAPGGVLVLSSPKELGEITLPGLELSSLHTYARAQISTYYKK